MKKIHILVELGNLGSSVIDHLMTPLARASNVEKVEIFCRTAGPDINKAQYYNPPNLLNRFAITSVLYQWTLLFFKSLFSKPSYLAGYLLNPHGIIAFTIAKLTRKRVILSLIAGIPELYSKASIKGIDFNRDVPPWRGRLLLWMLKRSDIIITTGSVTKQYLIKHGIDPDRIHPIINPANRTKFFPIQTPKIYDTIFVSRIAYIKHVDTYLHAISIVKRKFPSIKACIVGNGPLEIEMKHLANNLGIENNVEFLGWRNDVALLLNSSRIFVHTSEREGFPNAFLEAMLCGLGCVVSNCGDIIDIAKNEINSIVVDKYDDHYGFANAIIKLLDNHELYEKISKNAMASMALLSDENTTAKWEAII